MRLTRYSSKLLLIRTWTGCTDFHSCHSSMSRPSMFGAVTKSTMWCVLSRYIYRNAFKLHRVFQADRDVDVIRVGRKNTVETLRDQLQNLLVSGHDDAGFPILSDLKDDGGTRRAYRPPFSQSPLSTAVESNCLECQEAVMCYDTIIEVGTG